MTTATYSPRETHNEDNSRPLRSRIPPSATNIQNQNDEVVYPSSQRLFSQAGAAQSTDAATNNVFSNGALLSGKQGATVLSGHGGSSTQATAPHQFGL